MGEWSEGMTHCIYNAQAGTHLAEVRVRLQQILRMIMIIIIPLIKAMNNLAIEQNTAMINRINA
jgi:hypothetical protein